MRGLLQQILKKDELYELTGSDIESKTGYQPVTYDKLANIQSIDQLFNTYGKNDSVIILYLSSWNSGHYTLLFKQNNVIQFFDSYGLKEDYELQYIPFYLDQGGQPHLSRIMADARTKYRIDHNTFQLQKQKNDTKTCGIWCVTRLRFRYLSHEQFYRLFTENKPMVMPDELLVLLNYFDFYFKKGL